LQLALARSRRRISPRNSFLDKVPAFARIEGLVGFDIGSFSGKLVVLNHRFKPNGIVALSQVVVPGTVVDSAGKLKEQHEILRPQIERLIGPAEIKAKLLAQITFGVFASVTLVRVADAPALPRAPADLNFASILAPHHYPVG
jgi:hypothetical protein